MNVQPKNYTKSDIKVYWSCPTAIFSLFQIYFVGTIHSSKTKKKIPKLNSSSTLFVCRLYLVRFFLSMLMLGIPLKVTLCVKQIAEIVIKLRKCHYKSIFYFSINIKKINNRVNDYTQHHPQVTRIFENMSTFFIFFASVWGHFK